MEQAASRSCRPNLARFNIFIDHDIPDVQDICEQWLLQAFPDGTLFQVVEGELALLSGLPAGVVSIRFDSRSCSDDACARGLDLHRVQRKILIHRVYDDKDASTKDAFEDLLKASPDDVELPIRVEMLPSRRLLPLWDELVFEPSLHTRAFNSLERTVNLLSRNILNDSVPASQNLATMFNGMILFWGPPGSGKSSLCRALAQSLAIRFKEDLDRAVLLEIDAHAFHSRYFGESARLVQETFDRISGTLQGTAPPLVCVLIDEVESLAACREVTLANGNEPKDAMRALNALLTSIDRIRAHPSLLVFCTSNIVTAMDKAFLDRFDFKWYIPEPSIPARYEILRRQYHELLDFGAIQGDTVEPQRSDPDSVGEMLEEECLQSLLPPWWLPSYQTLPLVHDAGRSRNAAFRLERLAALASGVSARSLCKLPWTSMVFRTEGKQITVLQAMDALEEALKENAIGDRAHATHHESGTIDVERSNQ